MTVTLLNWIYVAITTYIIGWFCLNKISPVITKDGNGLRFCITDRLFAGFFAVTTYAAFFSIFYKVGIVANTVLIAACLAVMVFCRKEFARDHKDIRPSRSAYTAVTGIIAVLVFLFILMYTAESDFHYDTGLYHAQSIHWIEDYGLVRGLGLLHFRLAYNSNYFPVCALYSLRDLTGGQSLHSLSGYLTMITGLYALSGLADSIRNRTIFGKTAFSDALRLAPLLGIIVVCMELTSPETDFAVTFTFFWMCIRYAEITERDEDNAVAFALLSVTAVVLVGLKLTAAVSLLLVAVSVTELVIKYKRYDLIAVFAIISLIVILPYLIRNYYISGWLVYPFGGIDVFDVAWKIPKEVLAGDAGMITQGSQVGNDGIPEGVVMEALGWLKRWWTDNYYATRMFYTSIILSAPAFVFVMFRKIGARARIMLIMLVCALIFWFIKAPAIRYGYTCVLTFPLAVCGCLIRDAYLQDKPSARSFRILAVYAVSLVVYLPTLISVPALIKYDYEESGARFDFGSHLFSQADYPVSEAKERKWHGMTVYYPAEGDQMWYTGFVSTPYAECYDDIEWFTDNISDGFYLKDRPKS